MDAEEVHSSVSSSTKEKGGFRDSKFIYVFSTLDNIGFVANAASLVLYFHIVMQFNLTTSANTLKNFLGSTFLLTMFGGFISDTHFNRFCICLSFGILEILGYLLLFVQAYSPKLQPDPCYKSRCLMGGEAAMFYCTIFLLAVGAGGVKGSITAHGADQFDQKDRREEKALASFFNCYQFSITIGSVIGVSSVIWVALNKAWHWAFLMNLIAASIGFVVLALGKPFYRLATQNFSPLVKISQVIAAAIRNRNLSVPENAKELYETDDKDAIGHTSQFMFLDKAATVQEGMTPQPWKVCTVTQVEEFKILIRMLPILLSTVIMNTCMAQLQTYSVLQGYSMNTLVESLKFPSASIPVIPLVFMAILLPIYEFLFVPLARKFTGHLTGITLLQRVGIGLVLSFISMGIAGLIEVKRRHQALKDPLQPISLFWLSFQYAIFGVGDMFALVGLAEFFYREAPKWMRSVTASLATLSFSFGYFLSTVVVNLVNAITKKVTPSKQGWLEAPDLNRTKLELFYWFLAILSILNFVNYLYWASWYKYKSEAKEVKESATYAVEN